MAIWSDLEQYPLNIVTIYSTMHLYQHAGSITTIANTLISHITHENFYITSGIIIFTLVPSNNK